MICPAKLDFQQRGFYAGDVGPLKNFDTGNVVTPVDLEDGAEAALVKPLQEANMLVVGYPGFRAIQKSSQHNCFVHTYVCVGLEVVVGPDSFV